MIIISNQTAIIPSILITLAVYVEFGIAILQFPNAILTANVIKLQIW